MNEWMVKYHDLKAAVVALYYSAYWHADRPVDEAFFWKAVRDAAEITPGRSADRLGPDRTMVQSAVADSGRVAWSDALLIIQRGMDAYKAKHPKWWKRMDGTPILNDLPVVIAEVVAQELHYPPTPQSSTGAPEGWRLVPAEITSEMVQAAEDRQVEGANYIAENSIQFALWQEVWRAMLQAAPRSATGLVVSAEVEQAARDERFSNEYVGNLLRAYLP